MLIYRWPGKNFCVWKPWCFSTLVKWPFLSWIINTPFDLANMLFVSNYVSTQLWTWTITVISSRTNIFLVLEDKRNYTVITTHPVWFLHKIDFMAKLQHGNTDFHKLSAINSKHIRPLTDRMQILQWETLQLSGWIVIDFPCVDDFSLDNFYMLDLFICIKLGIADHFDTTLATPHARKALRKLN